LSNELSYTIKVDTKTGELSIKNLDEKLVSLTDRFGAARKAVGNMSQGLGGLYATITASAAVWSSWQVGKGFLETAASFEQMEVQLRTITGSSENARQALDWIATFARTTPYEINEVTEAFTRLSAYGINARKWMQPLGDTASAMGKTMMDAVEMMSDAMSNEFERLKEFGIRSSQQGDQVLFRWNQNGREMVISAQKTSAGISSALATIFKRFKGGMDAQSQTFNGMMSNIKDTWTLFMRDVMQSGPFQIIREEISLVLDQMSRMREEGTLDAWVRSTASGILDVFSAVSYGLEGAINGIRAFKLGWHSLKYVVTSALGMIAEGFGYLLEGMNDLRSFFGMDLVDYSGIHAFRNQMQMAALDASIAAGDISESMSETMTTFDNFRSKITKVQDKLNALPTNSNKAKEAITHDFFEIAQAAETSGNQITESALQTTKTVVSLYAELFEKTGLDDYASKAIAANEKILDSEEQKWAQIMGSDVDAHQLRLIRENDYVDSLYNLYNEVVDLEADAANERLDITEDLVNQKLGLEKAAAQQQSHWSQRLSNPSLSSMDYPIPPGTQMWERNGNIYFNFADLQRDIAAEKAYNEQLKAASNTLADINHTELQRGESAESLARAYADAAERVQNQFQSAYDNFSSYLISRQRQDWDMADWQSEMDTLSDSFKNLDQTTSSYWDDAIGHMNDMVDALKNIDRLEQEGQRDQAAIASSLQGFFGSIDQAIMQLTVGSLAPNQTVGNMRAYYDRLFGDVTDLVGVEGREEDLSKAIQALTAYIPEYQKFMSAYTGDSTSVADSLVSDLKDIAGMSIWNQFFNGIGLDVDLTDMQFKWSDIIDIAPEKLNYKWFDALLMDTSEANRLSYKFGDAIRMFGKTVYAWWDVFEISEKEADKIKEIWPNIASVSGRLDDKALKDIFSITGHVSHDIKTFLTLTGKVTQDWEQVVEMKEQIEKDWEHIVKIEETIARNWDQIIEMNEEGDYKLKQDWVNILEVTGDLGERDIQTLLTISGKYSKNAESLIGIDGKLNRTWSQALLMGAKITSNWDRIVDISDSDEDKIFKYWKEILSFSEPYSVSGSMAFRLKEKYGLDMDNVLNIEGKFEATWPMVLDIQEKIDAGDIDGAMASMNELVAVVNTDLMQSTDGATNNTNALSAVLQNTETPFSNVTDALQSFGTHAFQAANSVNEYFQELARRISQTYNTGNVGKVIDNFTKTEYVEVPQQTATVYWEVVQPARDYYKNGSLYHEETIWGIFNPFENVYDRYIHTDRDMSQTPVTILRGAAKGGYFTSEGVLNFAEAGPEFAVPAAGNPNNETFLRSVGVNPQQIANEISKRLNLSFDIEKLGKHITRAIQQRTAPIHLIVEIDGRKIASVLADQYSKNNTRLKAATRRAL